jgi:hypothetical protein
MEGSDSLPGNGVSLFAVRCMQSRWICLSTAVIPSLDLLESLRLTLCLMRLALPPAAADQQLGPAGEFTVDSVSNVPCSAA